MTSELVNCLICNSSLNRYGGITNESDDEQEEVDSKKYLQTKLGLQLLNKLLNVEGITNVANIKKISLHFGGGDYGGDEDDGRGDIVPTSRSPPCCEECGVVFGEMMRLQHAIEELQISLMKQVDKLKDSLLKSDYQEDPLKLPNDLGSLLKLRNQLLTYVRSQKPTMSSVSNLDGRPRKKKRRRPPSPPSSTLHQSTKQSKIVAHPKEHQPCSVILTRLSSHQLNSYLKPIQIPEDDHYSLSTENLSTTDNPICRNTRKSKLKAIQFINQQNSSKNQGNLSEEEEECVPSPEETGNYQDDNDNYDDSGDDYPWESEIPPVPPPSELEQKFSPLTPSIQRLSKPSKKFYLISPSTLLYQYTLIKVTQGYTQFTCQDPQCPCPIFSDPSLNWTNLFYLIADHIEATHYTPPQKSDPLTLPQKCPLCPLTFPPGPQFRSHLVGTGTGSKGHAIETVVCETCWKPMRNVADFYRAHQWRHKNSQEKEETEGGPPPKVVYDAKRKLSSKQFRNLRKNNKMCKDPSILEAISVLKKVNSGAWTKKTQKRKTERVKRRRRPTTLKKDKPRKSLKIKTKVKLESPKVPEDEDECLLLTTPSPKGISKFIPVSPDTLLYQYTLIKVSQGYTRFTCQESQCPSPEFSSAAHEPLNWRNLFDQIAIHIDSTHGSPLESDVRECVLCSTQINGTARNFRCHFTRLACGGHGIKMVICQICLKPLRNVADFFRCHQWSHKNKREKKACEEGPPPKIAHAERQKLLKKGQLKPSSLSHGQLHSYLGNGDQGNYEVKLETPQQEDNQSENCSIFGGKIVRKQSNTFSKFSIISADALLYQYTLIKVSKGYTQFTCQESACPSPEFFTDELSNWRDLFNQIASHIESTHGNPLESDVRECCVCNTKFEGLAKDFRQHLTRDYCGGHWRRNVVCEICLMPLKNLADFYRCHQWSHKNQKEMKDCEGGPPPKLVDHQQESQPKNLSILSNIVRKEGKTLTLPKFYVISDKILLYKYTLIKVSHGYTQFTCQESQCPSPQFLTDELSNWRDLFEQIAGHIDSTHGNSLESMVRECVLCDIKLEGVARDFRRHFTRDFCGGHSIRTVICEICLRPVRNVADLHRCHQWSHKTKEEKRDSPEGPPSKMVYSKQKYSEKKGQITKSKDKLLSSSPKARYGKLCHNFAKIGMEQGEKCLLLYKYILLEATYGVSLSCQQPNCDHIINGTDLTCFEEFKKHVHNCHHGNLEASGEILCPLCGEKLGSSCSLRRHLLEERHSSECRFICTTCWKPFKQRNPLKVHEWSHKSEADKETSSEGPPPIKKVIQRGELHVCAKCHKDYTTEYGLKCHLLTHLPKEQRKQYMCHQCPMQFLSAVAVRAHVEREHQRELMRMRSCPICNKEYNWRDGYKFRTHVRSHKDERNWVCDKCGMAFLNTQGLRVHTAYMHGNRERRFQCEFCEMNYMSSRNLSRHRKTAHKDKMRVELVEEEQQRLKFTLAEYRSDFIGPRIAFPCPACEKVFPLRSRMKKHLKEYCKAARESGEGVALLEGN